MTTLMIIDATHPEETRVAVTENGLVQDYDFVSASKKQIKGNIYLAKVTRVEPSLQAAFVEYGGNKQGFLPFAEIHPDYYQIPVADRQRLIEEQERFHREEEEAEEREEAENAAEPAQRAETAEDKEADGGEESAAPRGGRRRNTRRRPSKAAVAADDSEEVVETLGGDDVFAEVVANDDGSKAESAGDENGGRQSDSQRRMRPTRRYKIQEVVKRGQILLVQVIKEERGNKGAALTSYISLPGRYCVLMPNTSRSGGVSKKINDPADRKRLKSIFEHLDMPAGMSVIIRTAGIDRSKTEIKRDFDYLMKLWSTVRENTLSSIAPAMVYEEGDLIKRSLRDVYHTGIEEIVVDGDEGYRNSKELMKMLMPSHAAKVKQFRGDAPVFHAFGIEEQLLEMQEPTVRLPSGGYLVINATEALIAIDVNSGRSTGERNIEETATKTNLEAAAEVARQLRLRDLAGLIVIDFIDMMEGRNRRAVEKTLKDNLKQERAKIQVGRISTFGLLEMTRQRLRPSINETIMVPCDHCQGKGIIRTVESLALQVMRCLESEVGGEGVREVRIVTNTEVALYMLNHKRSQLSAIEAKYGLSVQIVADSTYPANGFQLEKLVQRGNQEVVEVVNLERMLERRHDQQRRRLRQEREQRQAQQQQRRQERQERPERSEGEGEAVEERAAAPLEAGTGNAVTDESAEGERRGRRRRRRRGRRRGPRVDENGNQIADSNGSDNAEWSEDGSSEEGDNDNEAEMSETPEREAPEAPRRGRERGRGRGGRSERRPQGDEAVAASEPLESAVEPVAEEAEKAPRGRTRLRRPDARRTRAPRGEAPGAASAPVPEEVAPEALPVTSEVVPLPAKPARAPRRTAASRAAKPAAVDADAPAETKPVAVAAKAAPAVQEVEDDVDDTRPKRSGWWGKIMK